MDEMVAAYDRRSAARTRSISLPLWGFATFHATLLVVVAVLGLHWAGALGDLLGGLSTVLGLGAFLYLWLVTGWTNARVLRSAPIEDAVGRAGAVALLRASVLWGGVTGVLFVWGPLAALAGGFVVAGEVVPAVLFAVIGSVVAAAVGGIVGGVLALLDVLLVRTAARLVPA